MPIGEKLEQLGFRRVQFFTKEMFSKNLEGAEALLGLSSLVEVNERHKVGREIHVHQK
jgi:hypothetical protein